MLMNVYTITSSFWTSSIKLLDLLRGGALGVMVIAIGNGYGDKSSNPGRD